MEITTAQKQLMEKHLELVIQVNKNINLTRVDTFQSGQVLHIEDSLAALPEFLESIEGTYADLGTGGGFPGIPLSIATGRNTLLVDSVSKKAHALNDIVSKLGLSDQISTYSNRIETLAIEHPCEFSVLTARALSSLPSLLELASPLLCNKGRLICYKSAHYEAELEQALFIEDKMGMEHVSTRLLTLSDGTPRTVIVFQKVGDPIVKLPRRPGMAQKRPYNH